MAEEEPNTLVLQFPKTQIIAENDKMVRIMVDDAREFVKHLMFAFASPNKAVVRKDD